MLRIVVITERKGMTAIEPVPPRFTSFFGRSYFNHFNPPLISSVRNTLKRALTSEGQT
jgi:hypothetical protein